MCILYLGGASCSPAVWCILAVPGSSSAPALMPAHSIPLHSATPNTAVNLTHVNHIYYLPPSVHATPQPTVLESLCIYTHSSGSIPVQWTLCVLKMSCVYTYPYQCASLKFCCVFTVMDISMYLHVLTLINDSQPISLTESMLMSSYARLSCPRPRWHLGQHLSTF